MADTLSKCPEINFSVTSAAIEKPSTNWDKLPVLDFYQLAENSWTQGILWAKFTDEDDVFSLASFTLRELPDCREAELHLSSELQVLDYFVGDQNRLEE